MDWTEGPGVGWMAARYSRRRQQRHAAEGASGMMVDVAQITGDRWASLVLRSIFTGLRRFDEIHRDTAMATNILSERLSWLTAQGVIRVHELGGRRFEYRLTEKGLELYPILIAFRDWAMAAGYNDGLTIDRIDNARGYEPGNCRWATYSQQNRNYSRNRPIQFRGELVLIGDLAERHGMPADIVKNRVRRYGWTIEEALTIPVMRKGQRRAIKFAVHKANIDAMEKAA
mgnify:CR=1 FL=1